MPTEHPWNWEDSVQDRYMLKTFLRAEAMETNTSMSTTVNQVVSSSEPATTTSMQTPTTLQGPATATQITPDIKYVC